MLEMLKKSGRPVPMAAFVAASVLPVAFLALGASAGGFWLWFAFLYMAVLSVAIDYVLPFGSEDWEGKEPLSADNLLVGIGAAALVILPIATWAVAGGSSLGFFERLIMLITTGFWLGQVAHPAAHELIHRTSKPLFHLGQAVYTAMLFGHHTSAHRLVHHKYAASAQDPNSAREGEMFHHFAQRAWKGSFDAGLKAESEMRARASGSQGVHPYLIYVGGAVVAIILAYALAGVLGVLVWLIMAAHAQAQILVADYVQHYGLRRTTLADGTLEPMGPQHSWNTEHWFTSAMMLNAPRHSDHHMNPTRPYPMLRLPARDEAPRLPWPMPMACAMAFHPRIWKENITPYLAKWRPEAAAAPAAAPAPAAEAPVEAKPESMIIDAEIVETTPGPDAKK